MLVPDARIMRYLRQIRETAGPSTALLRSFAQDDTVVVDGLAVIRHVELEEQKSLALVSYLAFGIANTGQVAPTVL